MGWTGLRGNRSITEYAADVWRQGLEVVASNVHGSNEMYFALRREDGVVFGAVIIRQFHRANSNYDSETTFKVMDEDCGPYYYNASRKVLAALTPTTHANGLQWRAACAAKLDAKKARPKVGLQSRVEYGGNVYVVIEVRGRRGYRVLSETDGRTYRMSCQMVGKSKVL